MFLRLYAQGFFTESLRISRKCPNSYNCKIGIGIQYDQAYVGDYGIDSWSVQELVFRKSLRQFLWEFSRKLSMSFLLWMFSVISLETASKILLIIDSAHPSRNLSFLCIFMNSFGYYLKKLSGNFFGNCFSIFIGNSPGLLIFVLSNCPLRMSSNEKMNIRGQNKNVKKKITLN